MENLDVYEDLVEYDLGTKLQKLEIEVDALKTYCGSLEDDIRKLCDKILEMRKVQENLEKNVSELYKTAKAEIERKDRTIADLRTRLDDHIFKRRKPQQNENKYTKNSDQDGTSINKVNDNLLQNCNCMKNKDGATNSNSQTELPLKQNVDNKSRDRDSSDKRNDRSELNYNKGNKTNEKRYRDKDSSPEDKNGRKRSRYDYQNKRKHSDDRSGGSRNNRNRKSRSLSRDRIHSRRDGSRERSRRHDAKHSKDRNYNSEFSRRLSERETKKTDSRHLPQRDNSPEIELPSLEEFPLVKDTVDTTNKSTETVLEENMKVKPVTTAEPTPCLPSEIQPTVKVLIENINQKPCKEKTFRSRIFPKPNLAKATKERLVKLGVSQAESSSLQSYRIPKNNIKDEDLKPKTDNTQSSSISKLIEQEKARILITDPKQSPVHESSRTLVSEDIMGDTANLLKDSKISAKRISLEQYRTNLQNKNEIIEKNSTEVLENEYIDEDKEEGELDDSDSPEVKETSLNEKIKTETDKNHDLKTIKTDNTLKRRKSSRILKIEEQKKKTEEDLKVKESEQNLIKEENNKKEKLVQPSIEIQQVTKKEIQICLPKLSENELKEINNKNEVEKKNKSHETTSPDEKIHIISHQIIKPAIETSPATTNEELKSEKDEKGKFKTLQDVVSLLNLSDYEEKPPEPSNNNIISASEMNLKVFSLSNTSSLLNTAESHRLFQIATAQPEIPNLNLEDIMATTNTSTNINPALFNQNANFENVLNLSVVCDVTLPSVTGTAYLNDVSLSGDGNIKSVQISIPEINTESNQNQNKNIPINIPERIIKTPKMPSIFSPLKCDTPKAKKSKKAKTNVIKDSNGSGKLTFVKQIEEITNNKQTDNCSSAGQDKIQLPVVDITDFIKTIKTDQDNNTKGTESNANVSNEKPSKENKELKPPQLKENVPTYQQSTESEIKTLIDNLSNPKKTSDINETNITTYQSSKNESEIKTLVVNESNITPRQSSKNESELKTLIDCLSSSEKLPVVNETNITSSNPAPVTYISPSGGNGRKNTGTSVKRRRITMRIKD